VDEFLTVAEVAEMLKLNQQTIRNWIDKGDLAAVRIGRRVRIRREDLDAKLAEGYQPRRGPKPQEPGSPHQAEAFWTGGAVAGPD
jgi:excisionase family DNA binding protein